MILDGHLGGSHGNRFVGVSYRPEGRGQQTRKALVHPERLEGLAAWLTEQLGKPVHLLPGDGDQPDPSSPPKSGRKAQPEPVDDPGWDSDDMPEPPGGHPAFEEPPVDPGWDRQWVDADDARWGDWAGLEPADAVEVRASGAGSEAAEKPCDFNQLLSAQLKNNPTRAHARELSASAADDMGPLHARAVSAPGEPAGAQERADHIAEWVGLTEEKNKSATCADIPKGPGQPKGIALTPIPLAADAPAASHTAAGDTVAVPPSAGAGEGMTVMVMPQAPRCSPWSPDADPLPALIWWDAAGRGHLAQPTDPRMTMAESIAAAELVGQVEPGLLAPDAGLAPGGGARAGPW